MNILRNIYSFFKNHIISILVALIVVTGFSLYQLQRMDTSQQSLLNPTYHFYFIGQNSVDPFWKEVRRGVTNAAKDYNVVVEFNAPRFNNPEEELKYLDMAITSNVDGIITHVSNGLASTELINKAYNKGIPVVTIENDNKYSNRNAFVGTNSFLLGKEAAELMVEATDASSNIAIIVSSDFELDTASQNLRINGFLSTIKEYPEMKVIEVYTSEMGILSAEEITQAIITSRSEVDAIFTTNSVDTLGAAQLIVDHNKVGEILLVGYGNMENILRYIDRGIIYGTVMSEPYKMGYESLKALMDIKETNNVSTFIDTGVKIIKKSNLEEYQKSLESDD
ncbi:sugar-binding protein [Alkaliphilus peptidifermentans]|uniref:Monosaccharide ABC transporter substrate-binding protein, CUT2 family n=1 Tax=Alkaliphilus peptidifermentans DSM 18978 TaxID=1120976 RepID=A0A1G5FCV4_9FIRM|nr:sugar-binding protein [Alkaliphilus peptidifermentans]SCY37033.1 monosaccharide ABC transporter substrate-binding protein, CUT2 family [Alkaliphilus peptidifermentans DSM 18978]